MKIQSMLLLITVSICMVHSIPVDITMNSIGEAFTRLQQRLLEVEKLLPILTERLRVASNHATTISTTWNFVNQTKVDNIQRMLHAYEELPMSYPANFEQIRNDLQYLDYYLCMKNFRSYDRERINRRLNTAVDNLNADFEKMSEMLTSPKLKALEIQREEIEVTIGLLQFYLNRYYNDKDTKTALANEQIDLIDDLVADAAANFFFDNGAVKTIQNVSFDIQKQLKSTTEFLKNAIKTMIPRPQENGEQ